MKDSKPFIDKKNEIVPLMYKGVQIGVAEVSWKNNKIIPKITAPIGTILELMEEIDKNGEFSINGENG